MKRIRVFPFLVAAIVLAHAGHAQQLVRSVPGTAAGGLFGKTCIRIADQNSDGLDDLLVGSPGFNLWRGAIYCVSGAYLAFGTGSSVLWSATPASSSAGDLFGASLTVLGNVVGTAAPDFAVRAPGHGSAGAIYVVDGFAHSVSAPVTGLSIGMNFGTAVASLSDMNGDGCCELAVGAPGQSAVFILSGASLFAGGPQSNHGLVSLYSSQSYGSSLAGGFDLNGDGFDELAIGAPLADGPGATDAGALGIFNTAPGGSPMSGYFPSVANERLGSSVDASHDYDGDGVVDIVVGAPNSPRGTTFELGRAVVLSGARLRDNTPPYEIFTLALPASYAGNFHFGAAVRASDDLNDDGVGDILVGMPDFHFSGIPPPPAKGGVRIFSGASGTEIAAINGVNGDSLGDALAGAIDDLEGDGFAELVVAGSGSDVASSDGGVVKCYRLFPVVPATYCTGKINSLGCTPSISFSGTPSASSTTSFLVNATSFVSQKNGLLFHAHQPTSVVFQGGFLCVKPPSIRTPVQNSGGTPGGGDCTGTYSLDFSDWMVNGVYPTLVAGAEVYCQYWSRDPQSPSTTSLSNALRFLISP